MDYLIIFLAIVQTGFWAAAFAAVWRITHSVCLRYTGYSGRLAGREVMGEFIKRSAVSRRHLPILFIVVLAIVFLLVEYHMALPRFAKMLKGKLSDVDETRIQILLDLTKLLITIALSVIGGTWLFLKARIERIINTVGLPIIAASVISVLSALFSIFFGLMSFNVILYMLAHDSYSSVDVYANLQYATLLLAIVGFFACVFYVLLDILGK